jgi:hypothetical protein
VEESQESYRFRHEVIGQRASGGAGISQSDQRSLGNAKPGDLALVWVPDTKLLYGIFEITSRIFYDESDIGWTKIWPYRCRLKLWDSWIRTVADESKAKLMSFVSRELVTLTDLSQASGANDRIRACSRLFVRDSRALVDAWKDVDGTHVQVCGSVGAPTHNTYLLSCS